MKGPYKLDAETIDAKVTRMSPGNYVLGRKNEEGKLFVGYVGRSDSDVRAQLKSRVDRTKDLLFKFSYANSPEAAFEKQCKYYHDFDPPGNYSHPARPRGTTWRCPRCDIFGLRGRQ